MTNVINPAKYGISFSIKQCRNFQLNPGETLGWLIANGWRRFRLMSYWNEHEKQQGEYDFSTLDAQIASITKAGGVISLCLGVKQPRWPEYHWPDWARTINEDAKTKALLEYIATVVKRYHDQPAIISYQLENEALLNNFGKDISINRGRLRSEYKLVHELDTSRPIIMSTSNSWGIPLRAPKPDSVGFSIYTMVHSHGRYHATIQSPWLHQFRRFLVQAILKRPVIIHELQCEPWGPTAIWKMTPLEQDKSMSPARIAHNITWAQRVGANPIDIWGAEWWYWRWRSGDSAVWQAVVRSLESTKE